MGGQSALLFACPRNRRGGADPPRADRPNYRHDGSRGCIHGCVDGQYCGREEKRGVQVRRDGFAAARANVSAAFSLAIQRREMITATAKEAEIDVLLSGNKPGTLSPKG